MDEHNFWKNEKKLKGWFIGGGKHFEEKNGRFGQPQLRKAVETRLKRLLKKTG